MKTLKFCIVGIMLAALLIACSETKTDETTTGNVIEISPEQSELDEIALEHKPEIIQDFFELDPKIIGLDFCYDRDEAHALILRDSVPENWTQYEVHEDYFTLYNKSCKVMLEFMKFDLSGEKYAFLSQMNSSVQQFDFLKWNDQEEQWEEESFYPSPALEDYFSGLDATESEQVREYGADFIYLDPGSKSATFIFSEYSTELNMGEKQLLEFDLKPSFTFDLLTDKEELYLKASPLSITGNNELFFVAYSKNQNRNKAFRDQYNNVLASLGNYPINTQIITHGDNEFKVFFPADTFDLNSMEQFEPRDGFWFYQKGKEPLDIAADQPTDEIIQQAQTYFMGIE